MNPLARGAAMWLRAYALPSGMDSRPRRVGNALSTMLDDPLSENTWKYADWLTPPVCFNPLHAKDGTFWGKTICSLLQNKTNDAITFNNGVQYDHDIHYA